MYSGRAFRMGLDLGFNLPLDSLGLSPTEIEVRKITFWGCFTIDKYAKHNFMKYEILG
jgi:hypothetical protein